MMSTFQSFSLVLLLLMAASLITKKTSGYKANAWLAVAYVFMAYEFGYSLLLHQGNITELSFLFHSDFIFFYLACPSLYVYLELSAGCKVIARRKHAIHLLPAMPGLVYFMGKKLYEFAWGPDAVDSSMIISIERTIHQIGLVTLLVYLFLSWRLITRYGKSLRVHSKVTERMRLYWLKTLLPLFMLSCFILFLSVAEIKLPLFIQAPVKALLILLILYLFVKHYHSSVLFFDADKKMTPEHKYANSNLSQEQLTKYAERLTDIMESMSLYLNRDLCIEMVASEMGISHHLLSQIVNQKFGQSFPEYINHYRIAYAKNLLCDPAFAKLKSSYIANQCGFNTRENFSTSFKKITGISLAVYMREVKDGRN